MMILISILAFIIGLIIAIMLVWSFMEKVVFSVEKTSEKHAALFRLMNNWVYLYQNKKSISNYLIENDVHTVAIYGLSNVGETLYNELIDSDVKVIYGIDQSIEFFGNIPVYKNSDMLPKVDMIIVTAITSYKDIERELKNRVDFEIASLEEIILSI